MLRRQRPRVVCRCAMQWKNMLSRGHEQTSEALELNAVHGNYQLDQLLLVLIVQRAGGI